MVSPSYKLIANHVFVRPWLGSRHNGDAEKVVVVLQLVGGCSSSHFSMDGTSLGIIVELLRVMPENVQMGRDSALKMYEGATRVKCAVE
jgi:Fe-S cluster biogenesis protein NfuA